MRQFIVILSAIFTLGVGTLLAVPASQNGEQAKIEHLIQQLGSKNFRQRESATRELDAMGPAALAELKKASKNSDMEVANRAKALCEKIEAREENAKLIAPTYVELKFENTPVEEAVAELAKKSGMTIVIGGDKSHIAGRKVTLSTGRVAFWVALTKLCEKAELVDADNIVVPMQPVVQTTPAMPPPGPPVVNPVGPIRIQPIQVPPAVVPPVQIAPAPVPAPAIAPAPNKGKPAQAPAKEAPQKQDGTKAQPADAPPKQVPQAMQGAQPQPAQLVPAQIIGKAVPIRGGIRRPINGFVQNQNMIVLVDGKTKYPSYGENAIRVRALPNAAIQNMQFPPPAAEEIGLVINLTAEPRLQLQEFINVKIEKCLDDCKQDLSMSMAANDAQPMNGGPVGGPVMVRQIQINGGGGVVMSSASGVAMNFGPSVYPIKLKKGEKESAVIKELVGVATVKMRTPEENLVVVPNILKAKGETVRGKSNSELKVISIDKGENGEITVEVELNFSTDIQPTISNTPVAVPMQAPVPGLNGANGAIQIQIAPAPAIAPVPRRNPGGAPGAFGPMIHNNTGIELQDEKGKAFQVTTIQYLKQMWQQASRTMGVKFTFKPTDKDQGEAAKLVFKGTGAAVVEIPFVLKDVPVK